VIIMNLSQAAETLASSVSFYVLYTVDLDALKLSFPRWIFGQHWVTRSAGSDRAVYWAHHAGVTLSAFSVAGLKARIEDEERQQSMR
jgi:2-hydroxychromene-2-carboxylate isomerase